MRSMRHIVCKCIDVEKNTSGVFFETGPIYPKVKTLISLLIMYISLKRLNDISIF